MFFFLTSCVARSGGNTSVVKLSAVHNIKIEEGKITIVGSGFVVFRAMTDKEHQTESSQVFGQPTQVVHMRTTKGIFDIIPYFSDLKIKGVPTGGHSSGELKRLSKKWWAELMETCKSIKVGDSITIGYQADKMTISEFKVQHIIGAGSVRINPENIKAEQDVPGQSARSAPVKNLR